MRTADSMSVSMPISKKRCWILTLKDIKRSEVREEELLAAFRKRYTSARRLTFRPPVPSATDNNAHHPTTDSDRLATKPIEGGSLCVEVQFTGPQPIEGPACLMCELLQGSLVGARPVRLERGRKRKVRGGATGVATPLVSSVAVSPRCGSEDARIESSTTDAARRSVVKAVECNDAPTSPSRGGFAASAGSSTNACSSSAFHPRPANDFGVAAPATATATAATKRIKTAMLDDRNSGRSSSSSTSSSYDPSDFSSAQFYLSAASSSTTSLSTATSLSTTTTDLEDLLEDVSEGESSAVNQDMFTSAFEGWNLNHGNPFANAVAVKKEEEGGEVLPPSRLSSSLTTMGAPQEDLLRSDELTRRSATTNNTNTTNTTRRAPGLRPDSASGRSCPDGYDKLMLQEDIASLFEPLTTHDDSVAGTGAATVEEGHGLFIPPDLRRLCFASWVLDPVDAGTVVADENGGGSGVDAVGGEERRDERKPSKAGAAPDLQQPRVRSPSPSEWCDEEPRTTTIPAASVAATQRLPTGNEISLAWLEEARKVSASAYREQQKECDFHGHYCSSFPSATTPEGVPSPPSPSPSLSTSASTLPDVSRHSRQSSRACRFEFRGLESVVAQGYDLRDLAVHAKFFVDPEAEVERVAGLLLREDADAESGGDLATAAVSYPSIRQIWPEVSKMAHVRAVEVDLVVELRSSSGGVIYTGPLLKITYRRPATRSLFPTIQSEECRTAHSRSLSERLPKEASVAIACLCVVTSAGQNIK